MGKAYIIQVRTPSSTVQKVRKCALKAGAISVTSTSVGPVVQSVAIFKNAASKNAFEKCVDQFRCE